VVEVDEDSRCDVVDRVEVHPKLASSWSTTGETKTVGRQRVCQSEHEVVHNSLELIVHRDYVYKRRGHGCVEYEDVRKVSRLVKGGRTVGTMVLPMADQESGHLVGELRRARQLLVGNKDRYAS